MVLVAAVTAALVAPKRTMLLAATVLKLVPEIVTVVPTGPEPGVKDVMAGCAKREIEKNNAIKTSRLFSAVGSCVFTQLRNRGIFKDLDS
jgi:hypothetical protein